MSREYVIPYNDELRGEEMKERNKQKKTLR
jgi:hypothetical protein